MMVHSYGPKDLKATEALTYDLALLHRAVPIGDMRKALATAHHMALRELRQYLLDTEAMTDGQDPGAVAIGLLQSMAVEIKRSRTGANVLATQAQIDARTKLIGV